MEFEERLSALTAKIKTQRDSIKTEEATKNAFVMPFISTILGYDVFNPLEVVPEFIADVGVKKGEKIDYAIMRDGEVQILIECKSSTGPLRIENASQLYRYFSVTKARIAVLTNGEIYQFFTDLDAPNVMDNRPFLVLDMANIDESLIPELIKLSKEVFDLDSIISAAEELKYVGALKRLIANEFKDPDEEWVRFLATRVYEGSYTQRVKVQFNKLVPRASAQFLNDQVNDRLKTALVSPSFSADYSPVEALGNGAIAHAEELESGIVTTPDELEGFNIVKAIACSEVKPERIVARDQQSYFAILLDDNNRKTIARLHFNQKKQKYIGLLDANKVETRHPIASLDDIYEFADTIREVVRRLRESASAA
ncbi:restriction endonuclease [Diaminobutyricibacter tongyongensis]|uniref:Restriction endonuclease n=1 Tax=Leifsonia tongyongensis TaxID=1268043 RepID=A0A6L9XW50_9MICO|nr:restriction endonuclease [Diaminobutyricibacter tongyongensis]